jgi:hypothetical protein
MIIRTERTVLAAFALLGGLLLGVGAQDDARAGTLAPAPRTLVSELPGGPSGRGPAATLRSAITKAGRVEVTLSCRRSGTVAVLTPDGRRVAARRFRCRAGSARVALRRSRRATTIAIAAGGGELRMALAGATDRAARDGAGKPRASASAYDATVFTSCYGRSPSQGGGGSVTFNVQKYTTFGAPYYSHVYWRPWLHWVQRSTGQSGYYTDRGWTDYVSYPNTFGDAGRYGDMTPGATVFHEGGSSFPGQSYTTAVTMNYPGLNVLPMIETSINGVRASAWFPTTYVSGSLLGWHSGWCWFN